ncbi:MAG: DUF58 domain-containing protein [Prevotellaceae bacterium]|jgi:uncharacterized protein (DUF58 family)|nr:DUF58 domain-containing protein [Prevotellaceae bacterium]
METSELIKKVRQIEIKTRGLSNHIFAGEYHSAFKGRGMTFAEVREYQYGDDVRSIDWNVTARFNHPFVKVFEEERELTVMLLVDVSGSRNFGTRGKTKQSITTEIAATLAFSTIQNNDKVGVIFFSDKIEKFIPPQKGRKHVLHIIRDLIDFEPESKHTDISEALRYFSNVIKKRSTAFLISDFISGDFADALNIAARKHDIIALQVYDALEKELPAVGLIKFADAETDAEIWVDSSDNRLRMAYKNHWEENQVHLQKLFLKNNIDSVSVSTREDFVKSLMKLFKMRA